VARKPRGAWGAKDSGLKPEAKGVAHLRRSGFYFPGPQPWRAGLRCSTPTALGNVPRWGARCCAPARIGGGHEEKADSSFVGMAPFEGGSVRRLPAARRPRYARILIPFIRFHTLCLTSGGGALARSLLGPFSWDRDHGTRGAEDRLFTTHCSQLPNSSLATQFRTKPQAVLLRLCCQGGLIHEFSSFTGHRRFRYGPVRSQRLAFS
jgi:hypothetical protein